MDNGPASSSSWTRRTESSRALRTIEPRPTSPGGSDDGVQALMLETRRRFHEELQALEREILELGDLAGRAVARSVDALARRDEGLAQEVIAGDDELDELYLDIERRILDLLARQTPVATDLRLVSVMMHINLHLERIGDMGVNIAKITLLTRDQPATDRIVAHLQEMSDIVVRMLNTALDAFTRRDLDLCLKLPRMDDPVDELNRGMYRDVVGLGGD